MNRGSRQERITSERCCSCGSRSELLPGKAEGCSIWVIVGKELDDLMGGKVLELKGEKFINRIATTNRKEGREEGKEEGALQGEVRGIIGRGYRRGSGIESDMNDISTQYGISPENVERLYAAYRPGRISAEESEVYEEVLKESGLLNQDGTLVVS